jgi:PKD repeat protein
MPTTLIVAGKIMDEAGRPVAGATVSLSDRLINVVEVYSSGSGGFKITYGVEGTAHVWRIVASKQGFEVVEQDIPLQGVCDLVLILKPSPGDGPLRGPIAILKIAGTVVSKTGEPIPAAKITILVGEEEIGDVNSAPDGGFEFSSEVNSAENRRKVIVSKQGFKGLSQALRSESEEGLRLVLEPLLPPPPPPAPASSRRWQLGSLAAALLLIIAAIAFWPPKPISITFTTNPSNGPAPLEVQFSNRSPPNLTSFEWYFGDGGTDTNRDPTHLFKLPGAYQIILVGANGKRKPAIADQTIRVMPRPHVMFVASAPIGSAPLTVRFFDLSSDDVVEWEWDFGNGQKSRERDPPAVTYYQSGRYTVTLTVKAPSFVPGPLSRTVEVRAAPLPAFEANPEIAEPAVEISFHNTSNPKTFPKVERWDFGDKTSSEPSPRHIYHGPGTYRVRLTMKDTRGSLVETERFVWIKQRVKSVPDVLGLDLKTAERLVQDSGFGIDERPVSLTSVAGRLHGERVIGQSPAGNAALATNMPAILFIGRNAGQK